MERKSLIFVKFAMFQLWLWISQCLTCCVLNGMSGELQSLWEMQQLTFGINSGQKQNPKLEDCNSVLTTHNTWHTGQRNSLTLPPPEHATPELRGWNMCWGLRFVPCWLSPGTLFWCAVLCWTIVLIIIIQMSIWFCKPLISQSLSVLFSLFLATMH